MILNELGSFANEPRANLNSMLLKTTPQLVKNPVPPSAVSPERSESSQYLTSYGQHHLADVLEDRARLLEIEVRALKERARLIRSS